MAWYLYVDGHEYKLDADHYPNPEVQLEYLSQGFKSGSDEYSVAVGVCVVEGGQPMELWFQPRRVTSFGLYQKE